MLIERMLKPGLLSKLLLFNLLLLSAAATVWGVPRIKVLKLAVTNPADELRAHENITVQVAELKRIAPDFNASAVIVTTSDAATLESDARTIQTVELPS